MLTYEYIELYSIQATSALCQGDELGTWTASFPGILRGAWPILFQRHGHGRRRALPPVCCFQLDDGFVPAFPPESRPVTQARQAAPATPSQIPLDNNPRLLGYWTGLIDRSSLIRQIQASEAKAHLAQLLDEVERGETVIITRHGHAIARLVPETDRRQADINNAITCIEARRRHAPRITAKEILAAREEGRKS